MNKKLKSMAFYVALFAVILLLVSYFYSEPAKEVKIYSDLVKEIQSGSLKELEITGNVAVATKIDNAKFEAEIPSMDILYKDVGDSIKKQVDAGTLDYETPAVAESPINIECKVTEIKELGTHHMFIAEVVNVRADEKYMDEKGKFHLEYSKPIAYSHGTYFSLGKELGKFGYSVRKK